MSDIYLSITETPTVVTLTNPLVSSAIAQSVTVTNVVSVNVVTMPAITVQAAAPAVTTVAGTVSISNFPSTQTIAGTVTANFSNVVASDLFNAAQSVRVMGTGNDGVILQGVTDFVGGTSNILEGGAIPVVANNNTPLPISGTVTANGDYIGAVDTDTSAPPRGIAIGFLDANQSGNFVAVDNDNPDRHFPVKIGGSLPAISGTVTVGNSVTISSLPAISGTVTANDSGALTIVNSSTVTKADVKFTALAGAYNPTDAAPTYTLRPLKTNPSGTLLIDGTSSAGGSVIDYDGFAYVRVAQSPGSVVTIGSCVTHGVRLQDASGNNLTSTSIGGIQRLNVSLASAATPGGSLPSFVNVYGGTDGSAVRTISVDSTGRQNTNVQLPRVTFIDGSGTVATANTAITVFASSSTRSYLLVQVTTGSAFVNVGATATTVNGINLTAGQGYAWETTIPQGIVSIISTTTNSRYVAKEA